MAANMTQLMYKICKDKNITFLFVYLSQQSNAVVMEERWYILTQKLSVD